MNKESQGKRSTNNKRRCWNTYLDFDYAQSLAITIQQLKQNVAKIP